MKKEYNREELIEICKKAFVPHEMWGNRDSHSAQLKVGEALALLSDDCDFKILRDERGLCTDEETIWIEIFATDFSGFEDGDHNNWSSTYYLPTQKRIETAGGGDWY